MVSFNSAIARNGLVFSLAMTASLATEASSVKLIFAAENALYAAGYDIGKADGWVDSDLRSAIRQYQTQHQGLAASGQLDPETLSALGIRSDSNRTISGNDVFRQQDAIAELGLGTTRTVAESPAASKQKPRPQPVQPLAKAVEPTPAKPEAPTGVPQPQAAPEKRVIAAPKTVQTTVQPAPAPLEPAAMKPKANTKKVIVTAENKEEIEKPEMKAKPVTEAKPVPEPTPAKEPVARVERITSVVTGEVPSGNSAALPTEPTGAGAPPAPLSAANKEPADAPQPPAQTSSQRGFFSSLFDFLFGWLV